MDCIPVAIKSLVKRLESMDDVSRNDLASILFIVRLGDFLHHSFYGTFLTLSLVGELCEKLGVPDLTLEVEVFVMRWSFRQGAVAVAHRITFDYDMETVSVLTKIGRGVLDGTLMPKEGLHLMRDHEESVNLPSRWESLYRIFPGRTYVVPFMAASCATVYFGGTWLDFGFAWLCGLVGGLVLWASTFHEQIQGACDYLVAILTAMISVGALRAFPDSTCFSAQVLGTLYWFFYGTAFVLSLYEIANNQLMTGMSRFFQAILRSYGLAFGALIGGWLAAYGIDRWDAISAPCSEKTRQIDELWFILLFPISAVACLMQFRVRLGHFGICLIVQMIAYGSQFLIGEVWKQPEFLSNLVPTFLAMISSHVLISVGHRLKLSSLNVGADTYLVIKKKTDVEEVPMTSAGEDVPNGHVEEAQSSGYDSDHIGFVETGWAEKQGGGYTHANKLAYSQSDVWYCLLPALYLLVPGSKVMQEAFNQLLSALDGTPDLQYLGSLGTSLLLIGLGQVVGLRLGFLTLWAYAQVRSWFSDRCGSKLPPRTRELVVTDS